MRTITYEEFKSEAIRRFGSHEDAWTFTCPACGTDQSISMYKHDWLAGHPHLQSVDGYIGWKCIGILTGQKDNGIKAKARGEQWDTGCNFSLTDDTPDPPIAVLMPSGFRRPCFEFAKRVRFYSLNTP
jgi:hypothetical protein